MEKSLEDILYAFNAPLSEEQAWAVCHQCLLYLININKTYCCFRGLNSVIIGPDGEVDRIVGNEGGNEKEVTKCLGALVYQTIDWGLGDEESNEISPELTFLIEELIKEDDSFEKDEGIDTEELPTYFSLSSALKICRERHVEEHYRAVCRAIITEANELTEFLDKISSESVAELNRLDWVKLWIQLMKDLRLGVKLKSVEVEERNRHYELTPYEILMSDIRDRRYHLNKIMVNGDIPQHGKSDARSVIMDFIRSRPPLKPVSERVLKPKKSPKLQVREELMQQIKRGVSLKITPTAKLVDAHKKKLKKIEPIDFVDLEDWESEDDLEENEVDEDTDSQTPTLSSEKFNIEVEIEKKLSTLKPKRKIEDEGIEEENRPNFLHIEKNCIEQHVEDNEKNNNDFEFSTPKNNKTKVKVSEDLLKPLTPLSPNGGGKDTDKPGRRREIKKRHSITTIGFAPKFNVNNIDCLSLTLDELSHIRHSLTKAELEYSISNNKLYDLLRKGQICFICKKTKFSFFGDRSTKCKICCRLVCNKCLKQVNLPLEHFSRIPAYTLGPTASLRYPLETHYSSAPTSPERGRKLPFISDFLNHISTKRSKVPICTDCKDLVFQIVKASRSTLYAIGNSTFVPFVDDHNEDLIGTL